MFSRLMLDVCKCVHGPALRSLDGVGYSLMENRMRSLKLLRVMVTDVVDLANLLCKMSMLYEALA